MIYRFTSIEKGDSFVKLSTANNESVSIPNDKFVAINDESGDISIKTIGSRATIGTISEDIYNS